MDELSNRTFPELPRSYRAESRIIEETKFSIALLRTLASVVALTEGKQNSDLIDSRAREFASTWEDREALGFFAYDCPEFRDALRQLVKSLLIHDAPSSGVHYRTLAPINIINGVHPILRGHIESVQTLRVIPAQRSPIVAQFIAIIDERDIRPDVLQRPLNEFRRPKNGASAVWPVGSVLSARPVGSRR